VKTDAYAFTPNLIEFAFKASRLALDGKALKPSRKDNNSHQYACNSKAAVNMISTYCINLHCPLTAFTHFKHLVTKASVGPYSWQTHTHTHTHTQKLFRCNQQYCVSFYICCWKRLGYCITTHQHRKSYQYNTSDIISRCFIRCHGISKIHKLLIIFKFLLFIKSYFMLYIIYNLNIYFF